MLRYTRTAPQWTDQAPQQNIRKSSPDYAQHKQPITKIEMENAVRRLMLLMEKNPYALIKSISKHMEIDERVLSNQLFYDHTVIYAEVLYRHLFSYFMESKKAPNDIESLENITGSIIEECIEDWRLYRRALNRSVTQPNSPPPPYLSSHPDNSADRRADLHCQNPNNQREITPVATGHQQQSPPDSEALATVSQQPVLSEPERLPWGKISWV